MLLGKHEQRHAHIDTGDALDLKHIDKQINCTTLKSFTDKYHGIHLTNATGAKKQWAQLTKQTETAATAAKTGNSRAGFENKIAYLKMCVVSKLLYPMTYQSPLIGSADTEIAKMQRALDDSIFAATRTIRRPTLTQRKQDLGLGQTDLAATIDATASKRLNDIASDPTNKPCGRTSIYTNSGSTTATLRHPPSCSPATTATKRLSMHERARSRRRADGHSERGARSPRCERYLQKTRKTRSPG